jgi:hypothetical protein
MILGIYWNYKFPDLLYSYNYFIFKPGFGGPVFDPPSLNLKCNIINSHKFVDRIRELGEKYPDSAIFIKRKDNNISISIGYFYLLDYDFQIAKKIELMLSDQHISDFNIENSDEPELIRIIGTKREETEDFSKLTLFKTYALRPNSKYNHQIFEIGFECEILGYEKDNFLNELRLLALEYNIDELYYLKRDNIPKIIYLNVFFTNGRQGADLEPIKHVDIMNLEKKINNMKKRYSLKFNGNSKRVDSKRYYLLKSELKL